jgi:DNA-binding response OmpR family regulator
MGGQKPAKKDTGGVPVSRVLLVDDDADLLALMDAAFTRAGYATRTAANGRLALAVLKTYRPDLVVTDIVMPEMEGIGAIMEIKRDPNAPKIIAISGAGPGSRRDYLKWAKHLGADEVLAKPFRMSEMLALAGRVTANNSNHLLNCGS